MASFGIRTPTDLLNKLIEDQRDFEESHCLSARHAINATMTAYHLHEKWLETQCPAFADVEKVADGTKHFDASAIPTGEHKGAFQRSAL